MESVEESINISQAADDKGIIIYMSPRSIATNALRVVLVFTYIFLLVKFLNNPAYRTPVAGFNLLVHEAGHLFFSNFGNNLRVAGGTLFEIGLPLLSILAFIKQKDFFSISFSLAWTALALFTVGIYIKDTTLQLLPLVSVGFGSPGHDWEYLLGKMNLIEKADIIGSGVIFCGYVFLTAAVVWGSVYLLREWKKRKINV